MTDGIEVPAVTISYAQSLDGRIATATGDSKWISGRESLELAHRLREENDAVLVGIGTVLADDPELTNRLPGHRNDPVRVVLDSSLRLPSDSKIARTASRYRTIVFCSERLPNIGNHPLGALGIEIIGLSPTAEGNLDVRQAAGELRGAGCESLFVEGGSAVITSFLRSGLVSRLIVVTAPIIIGAGVEAIGDLGVETMSGALKPYVADSYMLGKDFVWDLGFEGTVSFDRSGNTIDG